MQMLIWLNLAFWIIDILVSELKDQLIEIPFSHISASPKNAKGSLSLMLPNSMTCASHNLCALKSFTQKALKHPLEAACGEK